MKKILILLFFIVSLIADDNYEVKLLEKVLPSLFHKKVIYVYADKNMHSRLEESKYLLLTDSCEKADILLGRSFDNIDEICRKKPFFTTYYKEFKNNLETVGAFYWRKGRPQIKFHKDAVKEKNIFLNRSLTKYAQ